MPNSLLLNILAQEVLKKAWKMSSMILISATLRRQRVSPGYHHKRAQMTHLPMQSRRAAAYQPPYLGREMVGQLRPITTATHPA